MFIPETPPSSLTCEPAATAAAGFQQMAMQQQAFYFSHQHCRRSAAPRLGQAMPRTLSTLTSQPSQSMCSPTVAPQNMWPAAGVLAFCSQAVLNADCMVTGHRCWHPSSPASNQTVLADVHTFNPADTSSVCQSCQGVLAYPYAAQLPATCTSRNIWLRRPSSHALLYSSRTKGTPGSGTRERGHQNNRTGVIHRQAVRQEPITSTCMPPQTRNPQRKAWERGSAQQTWNR
jgi:hypothetical protein